VADVTNVDKKILSAPSLVTQAVVDKTVTIPEGELPLSDGRR
jgi:hypothetical protein